MHSLSLKRRLGISLAVLVVIIISVLSVTAYIQFRETLREGMESVLLSQAEAVEVSMAADDSLMEARKEIQAFFGPIDNSESPVYRVWFEGHEEDYVASSSQEEWPLNWTALLNEAPAPGEYGFFDVRRDENPYRLLWVRQPYKGVDSSTENVLNIIIAVYEGHIDSQIGEFLQVLLILGTIIFLLSIAATLWILKWGMKPVARITTKMDNITGRNLDQLSSYVTDSPSELRPFVKAWGQMIERLVLAMRQQRRFTADASHELRTPLAIVKSTLQASRSRKRSTDDYEIAIDKSLEDLGRLEHLTEELLTLAHLDDIEIQLDLYLIDLGDLVASVCEQYLPIAKQENCILKWQICSAQINGNDEQLRRLVANLIDNAIKHGPEASEVSISMHSGNGYAQILVHDQGGSIPKLEQKHIFDRFYHVRKNLRKYSGGSGLGLALAQEIAQKHQGNITVESNPETGTDFIVTLPLI